MIVTEVACSSTAKGGPIHDRAACSVEMQRWGQVQAANSLKSKRPLKRAALASSDEGITAAEDLIIIGVRFDRIGIYLWLLLVHQSFRKRCQWGDTAHLSRGALCTPPLDLRGSSYCEGPSGGRPQLPGLLKSEHHLRGGYNYGYAGWIRNRGVSMWPALWFERQDG
jgi:hypothetical protein